MTDQNLAKPQAALISSAIFVAALVLVALAALLRIFPESGFMPHGNCLLWKPNLLTLYVVSDLLIGLAYYSIPFTLVYFVWRRKDAEFNGIFLWFAIFILACGTTHIMDVWTIWHPDYWLSGLVKGATALVSVPVAFLLIRLVPLALAFPGVHDLQNANAALEREIEIRVAAENRIRELNDELERRVQERTAELAAANEGLSAEITSREATQEALSHSEQQLTAVFESAFQLIMLVSTDGKLMRANRTARDFPDPHGDARLGQPLWDCLWWCDNPEAQARVREAVRRAAKGESVREPFIGERLDRPCIAFDFSFKPLANEDGHVVQILVEGHDISESIRIEQALRRSEKRLRTAQRLGRMGDWEYDLDTGEITWSDQVYRLLERDPAKGAPSYEDSFDMLPPDEQERLEERIREVITTGHGTELDVKVFLPSGRTAFHQSIITPQKDADGRVVRLVGTVQDITARKLAEQNIRELNETLEQRVRERTHELQQAIHELESFTYSVSHDLRAPLRSINGFAEIITKDHIGLLDDEGKRCFGHIVRASNRMGRLIDDLLAYSRLGHKAFEFRTVELGEVLSDVRAELSARIRSSDARIDIEPNPPEVLGDPTLLHQIFLNLIDNALIYHQPDRPPIVRVSTRINGAAVVVAIADEGIGIDEKYFEKIFEIFQRLHSDREIPGTGIGMAIVRKAVGLLHGRIWLESQIGRGTTFFVELQNAGFPPVSSDFPTI